MPYRITKKSLRKYTCELVTLSDGISVAGYDTADTEMQVTAVKKPDISNCL